VISILPPGALYAQVLLSRCRLSTFFGCRRTEKLIVIACLKKSTVLNFRYCVAWYPIYRIPDGKFQAAFLTYHSLGHWIVQGASEQADDSRVVLPVTGLESYNDKVLNDCYSMNPETYMQVD
jgi:hypothetical protein